MKAVIELVKTPHGFSIIQDGHELNKIASKPTKQKQYQSAPKKFIQQNFTIYPYLYCQQPEYSQKYIILPAKSQWFNLNQIHEIERKALPQWFKTKKAVFGAAVIVKLLQKPDKFQKNQELYRKYRNYIVEMGRNQYVSATMARKGLAGDVCAILRIHSFLQKNGLINYVFPKKNASQSQPKEPSQDSESRISLQRRRDCVDRQKTIFEKHFDKDHYELLKKITKKYRPVCHLCQGICGVQWYQYQEELYLKSFEKEADGGENGHQMQEEFEQRKIYEEKTSKQPKTIIKRAQKSFPYLLRLCSSCFTSGNLPVVLSHDDFHKKSILDLVKYHYEQPKDKKKIAEQNKLIEQLQKNKFHLKKTAESIKISEEELLEQLLCLPLIKIQKLARIDPQVQVDEGNFGGDRGINGEVEGMRMKIEEGMVKEEENCDEILLKQFEKQVQGLNDEQVRLYQQLIQIWLLKVSTKITKLSQWQKSTKWFSARLIDDQKNNLASALKQKIL